MDEGLIARRYAKAVFRYAQELNAADAVYEKMKLFEKNYIGEAYIKGIRLLIRNHREMYVRSICLMFQKIYRAANGIIRVKIITAMELSDETMDKIKEFVQRHTDKTIEFVHKVDPSIIGGFILQIGSRQLDASLMKELKEMSLQFGFLDYK